MTELNNQEKRRRPKYCPRCEIETVGMRMEAVRNVAEPTRGFVETEDEFPTMQNTSYETEEWVKYRPCGHVVPPEEHKELVNPTTPPSVEK